MIAPYFFSLALTIAIAQLFANRFDAGRLLVSTLAQREPQIDGLRGLCGCLVALHHLVFFSYLQTSSVWAMPEASHLLRTLGKSGVAMFFLICAYLFWGRIARYARFSEFNWGWLLENRVRRLVPMYVVAMTAAIVVVGFAEQGFVDRLTPDELAVQLLKSYTFDFFHSPEFNHSFIAFAAISVSWSLKYEWAFYAALPLISLSHIRRFWYIGLPLLILLNEFVIHKLWYEYFIYGSIVCELVRYLRVRDFARTRLAGLASIVVFFGASWFATDVPAGWPAFALALSFLPIAAGNDWLGLLSSRGLRALGAVSYSVYLLNIILESVLAPWLPSDFAGRDVATQTTLMTGVMLVIVAVSYLTYRGVEVPFQKKKPVEQPPEASIA